MSKNNNEDVEFENDGLDTSELNVIKPEPVKPKFFLPSEPTVELEEDNKNVEGPTQSERNEIETPDGTDLKKQLSEEEKQAQEIQTKTDLTQQTSEEEKQAQEIQTNTDLKKQTSEEEKQKQEPTPKIKIPEGIKSFSNIATNKSETSKIKTDNKINIPTNIPTNKSETSKIETNNNGKRIIIPPNGKIIVLHDIKTDRGR